MEMIQSATALNLDRLGETLVHDNYLINANHNPLLPLNDLSVNQMSGRLPDDIPIVEETDSAYRSGTYAQSSTRIDDLGTPNQPNSSPRLDGSGYLSTTSSHLPGSFAKPIKGKLSAKLGLWRWIGVGSLTHKHQTEPTGIGFGQSLPKWQDVSLEVCEKGTPSIYVGFTDNDIRDPMRFPRSKKWMITAIACFATLLASTTSSAYNMGFPSMIRDLQCSEIGATLGLSAYALGFGVIPLVTASLSEEFGRFPLYVGSGIGFTLMYLVIAKAKNVHTVIVARLIQGACGSTGATMVGGTIADIWASNERGLPMSIFAVTAVGGTGLGPVFAGWIEMNPHLQWKWIQWIQMMIAGFYLVILPFIMTETRSSIILTRMAKRFRKETCDNRFRARIEDERPKLSTLIFISCTRPVQLMFTEPVVSSFSIWVGFAWGVTYCMVESIAGVFSNLHQFNIGQIGLVFLSMVTGSLLGFMTNIYQEELYQRYFPVRGPEARLYSACCAGILLPIAMFIYAWSAFTHVPWIALVIGITLFTWGTFIIYLAVFSYLADCYGPFASSALAGQSLARNLAATTFPLFTTQMYSRLDYKWANTLFGCLSALMVPIPFALFFYGPAIRRRSAFSRKVIEQQTNSQLQASYARRNAEKQ